MNIKAIFSWKNEYLTSFFKSNKITSSFSKHKTFFMEMPMSTDLKKQEVEEILRVCKQCGGKEKKQTPHTAYYVECTGTIWRKMSCSSCKAFCQETISGKEEEKILKSFVIKKM